MIIAIDGPAGSGKSTIAKLAARKLGFHYLDTGAMYRAVAVRAVQLGIAFDDEAGLEHIAKHDAITFGYEGEDVLPSRVFIAGDEVTDAIRKPEIDKAVSPVSAVRQVREALVDQQRKLGSRDNYVVEGRDIGTVVFPKAEVKIFLTASPEERARRRAAQNRERGLDFDFDEVLADIIRRDDYDSSRALSPLKPAPDSINVDTTIMTIDYVTNLIVGAARDK